MTTETQSLQKTLITYCDIRNNSEVRAPLGEPLRDVHLLCKLLLDGGKLCNTIETNVPSEGKKYITTIDVGGQQYSFESETNIFNINEFNGNVKFTGITHESGSYTDASELVVTDMGIFIRTGYENKGLFNTEFGALIPYVSDGVCKPITKVPKLLFI